MASCSSSCAQRHSSSLRRMIILFHNFLESKVSENFNLFRPISVSTCTLVCGLSVSSTMRRPHYCPRSCLDCLVSFPSSGSLRLTYLIWSFLTTNFFPRKPTHPDPQLDVTPHVTACSLAGGAQCHCHCAQYLGQIICYHISGIEAEIGLGCVINSERTKIGI